MVLEHLFPESWLERKAGYAFLLGIVYSIIGIVIAKLLFGANSGLASVMFVTLLLIPSLKKMFFREENEEEKERRFTWRRLYQDNRHMVHTYAGIFFGVFFSYYLIAFLGLQFGWDVLSVFREQVFLDPAMAGRATYEFSTFWSILENNWWVLLACFLLSLISGTGATFFIVWNASAWGVIFGLRGVAAAVTLGQSPFIVGPVMLLIVLPHVIIEGGAYVLAGIAGSMLSEGIIDKVASLKRFLGLFAGLLSSFWFISWVLSFFGRGIMVFLVKIVMVLWFVRLLQHSFVDERHREMFVYNYWLFVIALAIFVIGALVETSVLSWSGLLGEYYLASMRFFL